MKAPVKPEQTSFEEFTAHSLTGAGSDRGESNSAPSALRGKRKGRYKKFQTPSEDSELNITRHLSDVIDGLRCALPSCGKPLPPKLRSQVRGRRHFCSREHYWESVRKRGANYRPHRQGQRIARAAVSKYFALKQGHIVHHRDGNNRNNSLSNLAVFSSQAQHMAFHRGDPSAVPIWTGPMVDMPAGASLPRIHAQEESCAK